MEKQTHMKTLAIECPSCGSSSAERKSRFSYICAYCGSDFKCVSPDEIQVWSTGLQAANACSSCGDTKKLKVCIFCKKTFCSAHAKKADDYDFSICKSCQREGSGADFLGAINEERVARNENSSDSTKIMKIEESVHFSLTEAFEKKRKKEAFTVCLKYFGISLVSLFVLGWIHMRWLGIIMLLASIPAGIFFTFRHYESGEKEIKKQLYDNLRSEVQGAIDALNAQILDRKKKIREADATKNSILLDVIGSG